MTKNTLLRWSLIGLALILFTGITVWFSIRKTRDVLQPGGASTPLSTLDQSCAASDDCTASPCFPKTCITKGQPIESCTNPRHFFATSCSCEDGVCTGHITDFRYFPNDISPSNTEHLVTDPISGEQLYANEILVGFHDAVTPERIITIIQQERGVLVGRIPELNALQIQIPVDTSNAKGVHDAVRSYQLYEEVEYAEPNFVTHGGDTSREE